MESINPDKMTISEMCDDYLNGTVRPLDNSPPIEINGRILHAIMGMVDEAGEMNGLAKGVIYYKKELDYVNLLEEMGDINVPELQGTYLMFPKFNYNKTSQELYDHFFEEARVSLSLGSQFGPEGDGHMRMLIATSEDKGQAKGMSINDAKIGEDVAVANIDGLIELKRGRITIFGIPSGREGGSAEADLHRLKKLLEKENTVCAIGIEALGALRKVGIEPQYFYAVVEVAADLARHGRSIVVVAVKNEITDLITRLEEEQIEYSLIDLYR